MIEYILLIIGLLLLVKGADLLVDSSIALSKKLGVSTLIIGLTVVAFGTSLPEFFVNLFAALAGNSQISIGNIIGSNLANITLILGIGALLTTIKVKEKFVFREIPYAFLAGFILFAILGFDIIDGITPIISRAWGITFLVFFMIFLYYMFKSGTNEERIEKQNTKMGYTQILIYLTVGILGLYFGGEWTVKGAIGISTSLGISTYLISAIVIAVGTSLPELFTTINSAWKGETNLLIGNLVGSNIFNVFWVLGFTALIRPILIPTFAITDLLVLVVASYALFVVAYMKRKIGRKTGIFLLSLYMLYIILVVLRR